MGCGAVWASLLTHLLGEGAGEGICQARALVLGVRPQHVVVQGAAGAAGQRGQRAQPDLHGDDEAHRTGKGSRGRQVTWTEERGFRSR